MWPIRKIFSALIAIFILQGCASESGVTELEGTWVSSWCNGQFADLEAAPGSSIKFVRVYSGKNVDYRVNEYSDTECLNLVATIALEASPLYVGENVSPYTFEIGNEMMAGSGAIAKELNVFDINGKAYPNIYQLSENGTELYFGIPPCQPEIFPVEVSNAVPACFTERPTDIDYNFYYIKQQ